MKANDDRSTHNGGRGAGQFHAVRFYETEDSIYRIVAEFVGDGLAAGQPAIAIATAAHRGGIVRALRARSLDVDRFQTGGALLLLDADETLADFMVNGGPDAALFASKMSDAVDQACRGRRNGKVRAYGEMVDVLWRDGLHEAAIRLEVLWNQLASARRVSLLCGCSMSHFYTDAALDDICKQHTHVVSAAGEPAPLIGA